MCISDFVLEYKIYRLLKKLSRQRAVVILQPGNVPVIEKAVSETEENDWIFYTCLMRGWIEVLQENVPTGALTPKGELPSGEIWYFPFIIILKNCHYPNFYATLVK